MHIKINIIYLFSEYFMKYKFCAHTFLDITHELFIWMCKEHILSQRYMHIYFCACIYKYVESIYKKVKNNKMIKYRNL